MNQSQSDIKKLTDQLAVDARAGRLGNSNLRVSQIHLWVKYLVFTRDDVECYWLLAELVERDTPTATPSQRPAGSCPALKLNSQLLTAEQLLQLWDQLPARVYTVPPTLAYSSDQVGAAQ